MDPQAQPPVTFFAMVNDKRNVQKAKVCRNSCAAIIENGKITKPVRKNDCQMACSRMERRGGRERPTFAMATSWHGWMVSREVES
jgi:hypothetical protein